MTYHEPREPTWVCFGCGEPWPCHTRRRQLIAGFDSRLSTLVLHMSAYFVQAARDLPAESAGDLHDRFVGWVDRVPSVTRAKRAEASPNERAIAAWGDLKPARPPEPT